MQNALTTMTRPPAELDAGTRAVLDYLYCNPTNLFRLLQPHWVRDSEWRPRAGCAVRFQSVEAEAGSAEVPAIIIGTGAPGLSDSRMRPVFEIRLDGDGSLQHAFADELTQEFYIAWTVLRAITEPHLARAGIMAEGVDWEALAAHPRLGGLAVTAAMEEDRDPWRRRELMTKAEVDELLQQVRPVTAPGRSDDGIGLMTYPSLALELMKGRLNYFGGWEIAATPALYRVLNRMIKETTPVRDNYVLELIQRNDGAHDLHVKYQTALGGRLLGAVSESQIQALRDRIRVLLPVNSTAPAQLRPSVAMDAPSSSRVRPVAGVPAPALHTPKARIAFDVLQVLRNGRTQDNKFYLAALELDPKLYKRVNGVLRDLGGAWKGGNTQAHVFAGPADEAVATAVATGDFTKPTDFGFFPTPATLADQAIALAGLRPGMRVLEPSGGRGALALRAAAIVGAENVTVCELLPGNVQALRDKGLPNVITGDFMELAPSASYDAVVMNPPFGKMADIKHVTRAARFLKADGVLVAIMSPAFATRDVALARQFKGFAEEVGASIKPIAAGAFKESGTNVATVMVRMEAANFPWNRMPADPEIAQPEDQLADETNLETVDAPRG